MRAVETESLPELVKNLAADTATYVRVELLLYRRMALEVLSRSKYAVVLLGAALLLVNAAVVTLFVGFMMQLAAVLGPALSGIVICVAVLIIAAIFGLMAYILLRGAIAQSKEKTR